MKLNSYSIGFIAALFSIWVLFSIYDNNAFAAPVLKDPNYKLDLVANGFNRPTGISFLGPNDFLVIEEDTGKVKRVVNGQPPQTILDVNVATSDSRGLLGIDSVVGGSTFVFLYFTESSSGDGGSAIGNRLYKYQLVNNQLVNPELLLDLPVNIGTKDNGGPVLIGSDNNVYGVIGHVAGDGDIGHETKAQNFQNGPDADGTSGIHRVTQDGSIVGTPILGSNPPLDSYFAYGIRNVFGMDFDPVTGKLWISENGVSTNDEINLVEPGFNGGWKDLTGLAPSGFNYNGLETFGGKGIYSDPEFVWGNTVSPTALLFLNTDKLGPDYRNDIFVGDYKFGRIYHFDLNPERNALLLGGALADKVANSDSELQGNVFAEGFEVVTDLEVGPDGLLYVTSLDLGGVYRISANTVGGGTDPVLPVNPASVTASGNDGNVPSNAFDNNLGTRWSNLGVGSFITANLGSAKTVTSLDIAWYSGASRTNLFNIKTSTDGVNFFTVFPTNGQTNARSALGSGFQSYDVADSNAKYVRVTVNGNSQNNWASISEIRIHGVSGPDTTRPTVVSTTPSSVPPEPTNVAATSNVVAQFSEPMNPATITPTTFTLVQASNGAPVSAAVSPSADGLTATLNPNNDLAPGVRYTATITTGTTDVAGNSLAANKVWSFTVAGGGTDPVLPVNPASVTASGNDGNVPSNAFDNNLGTRWSNLGVGSFITANLGSAKTVTSLDIAWYSGASRTNLFNIKTSTDGVNFFTVFPTNGQTNARSALGSGFQSYDVADSNAKYVRVTVNGNSQNNWASISEIRIFGVNTVSSMAP